jgi:hypothetical protein
LLLVPPDQPVGCRAHALLAALAAWRAAHKGPREYWVGSSAIEAIVGTTVAPKLLDRLMARTGYAQQISHEPEPPGRPDNLYEPVQADVGARGRFGDRALPKALILDATHARTGLTVALGAMLAGALRLAYLAGRRR